MQAVKRGPRDTRGATKRIVAVIVEGVRDVHARGIDGNYATMCGLDGDDPHPDTDQKMDAVLTGEQISCAQCRAIWDHAKKYRKQDFSE